MKQEEQEHERELRELLEEVRQIDVMSRRLVTDVMSGGYLSVFRGSGIEFDEVREYAVGDDPRSVDWNVTARVGRPFVKKYVDERELTLLFLLDLSKSMQGGFGLWSARQMAARIVGCLALAATRNGDKVGLVAFDDGVTSYVPAKKGPAHALRIIRDCLALPGSSARGSPAAALEFAARAVRRRAILFLVSDFLCQGWEQALALCARRHDVIAVRLLTPELATPGRGLMRVIDPESGEEALADWSNKRVGELYTQRIAEWRTTTEQALLRAKVDRMDVPVPRVRGKDLVAGPILRFFRMRELRGMKK